MKQTLAIFSPNQNAYSETFIHAHKNLDFNVKFYYGGTFPTNLEGGKNLIEFSLNERIEKRIRKEFNLREYALLYSLKREKVDCVLAEYGPTACATLKIVEYLKLPLIVHFFGFDASIKSVLSEYKDQYKELFSYASTVVVVSKKMRNDLIDLGCPDRKLIISVCGPDSNYFSNEPSYANPQFISVSRFVEKKAPYLTIVAFKKVVDSFPNAKLIIVGEGQLLGICKNLSRALNLDNNIEFKGIRSPREIRTLYQESIAFIQHSIVAENGDSEGTPVAVLDAQASGLPVISTFHAGIPDVIIDNETGLLVKELDVNGMANNMIRILNEKGLAKKLGEAGRERVLKCFTMEKHLSTLGNAITKSMIH